MRLAWRLAVVAVLDAAWLALFGASFALAAGIGVLNALLWPALSRGPLPFTLGTLALSTAVLDTLVLWLATSEVDLLALAGLVVLTALVGGALALDRGDLWDAHVLSRQLRHTEPRGDPAVPGLLLLEIDGLGHDVLRRALRNGDAPTLSRWLREDGYRLRPWETNWSSQTGACQAGLLHGDDRDMPAFRWWEKDRGRAIVTNHPRDAEEIERRISDGRGLLHAGGASRANVLSGDAPHSMLTLSTILDMDRPGALGEDYLSYFRSPLGVVRTVVRSVAELAIERAGARRQRRRDVQPRVHRDWGYAFLRAWATVVQLDLQVAAVTADVLEGRPVVYTTFLAYDEVAHHSGIERADTLSVLRRVDRAIDRIAEAVTRAERPYRVVVLSDHGQSQGATFRQRYGEGLEDLVARHAAGPMTVDVEHGDEARAALAGAVTEYAARPTRGARAVRAASARRASPEPEEAVPETSVMASGNLGLISFPREPGRLSRDELELRRPGLLEALRSHPGVGFVLVRGVVLGPRGERRLDPPGVDGEDPLAPFGEHALARVRRTDAFAHCPDVVVNGAYWADVDEVAAFEELVGSHGGLGGAQTQPFVLIPPGLPWPDEPVVGAPDVHRIMRGWLARAGHAAYAEPEAVTAWT